MQSFNLGNKSELLVTVHQPEGQAGPSTITLVTDQPAGMVMHWGVKKHGKGDWAPPPKEIIPKGSEQATDIAWETPLEAADSIQMQGDTLQLQKAVISIPAGLDLTGLTFVCKSKDGTMWWRDGMHTPLIALQSDKCGPSVGPVKVTDSRPSLNFVCQVCLLC